MVAIVASIDEAVELANLYAPEHLCLMVEKADSYIGKIRNAGCVIDGRKAIPQKFVVISSDNLLIENCVFRNAWNYLSLSSKNAILRNNVFYGTFVGGVGIGKSKCLFTHNII